MMFPGSGERLAVSVRSIETKMFFSEAAVKPITAILILCFVAAPFMAQTGPAVGQKIPAFSAVDQSGRVQTFSSLRGPKGLVLFFNRSVDW